MISHHGISKQHSQSHITQCQIVSSLMRLILINSSWELDICHTTQKTYKLPLKLVARSVQQLPSAATAGQCKITLGANKPVVDLNTLFPGRIIHFEKYLITYFVFRTYCRRK